MDDLVEQQRAHFERIADTYQRARKHPNHLLLKALIWRHFLARNSAISTAVTRVLEPMCGTAEGYDILQRHWQKRLDYQGFDYSQHMVDFARSLHPDLDIRWGDVTRYEATGAPFDLIILLGGLHHVYSRTAQVIAQLTQSLRPGGYFISLEPTHNNWLARKARSRIYEKNDLFDNDTEQGFEYRDLQRHFIDAGYRRVDEVYAGLLAYVLYYNPDAFPALNIGGQGMVRALFHTERLAWANAIGRRFSFATLTLWQRAA